MSTSRRSTLILNGHHASHPQTAAGARASNLNTAATTTNPGQTLIPSTNGLVDVGRCLEREIPSPDPNSITQGVVTRGARGRKSGGCTKVPPEFQPAKENDITVPAKKAVWILHPDHGEMVVAAGRTGPGPKSKVMKDGPQCPHGAQWVHVLCIFKHSVKVIPVFIR